MRALDIKKREYEKITLTFFSILAIIVSFYILRLNVDARYNLMPLLPFTYMIFTLMSYNIFKRIEYKYGITFVASSLVIFIRYVIMPFAIVFSSSYMGGGQGPEPSKSSIGTSILLMVIELLFVYIVILIAAYHFSKKQKRREKYSNKNRETLFKGVYFLKNKTIIIIFILITFPLISILDFQSLLVQDVPTVENMTMQFEIIQSSGLITILSSILRLSILFMILSLLKKSYNAKAHYSTIIVAWLVSLYYIGTIISTSRWNLIFSVVLILILLSNLFPRTPKIFIIIFLIIMSISFIGISMYKFSWSIMGSATPYKDVLRVMLGQFQEYFSGPRNIALALEMEPLYDNIIDFGTLFNDFVGSIPGISGVVDQTDRINNYFNQYLGLSSATQIIPLVGSGYIYFPFFPVVFTMVSYWAMMFFDYKTKTAESVELIYSYAYIGLFFSLAMGFNVQILFGNFLTTFVPLWLLFKLNSKIRLENKTRLIYTARHNYQQEM